MKCADLFLFQICLCRFVSEYLSLPLQFSIFFLSILTLKVSNDVILRLLTAVFVQ